MSSKIFLAQSPIPLIHPSLEMPKKVDCLSEEIFVIESARLCPRPSVPASSRETVRPGAAADQQSRVDTRSVHSSEKI